MLLVQLSKLKQPSVIVMLVLADENINVIVLVFQILNDTILFPIQYRYLVLYSIPAVILSVCSRPDLGEPYL